MKDSFSAIPCLTTRPSISVKVKFTVPDKLFETVTHPEVGFGYMLISVKSNDDTPKKAFIFSSS